MTSPGRTLLRIGIALMCLIGVVACVRVAMALLAEPRRPPLARWSSDDAPRVGSDAFLRSLSGAVNAPIRRGGRAELLTNGDAFLPALLREIERAEHSIHFMVYVWTPGEMSDRIFEALTRKAREGIRVRVVLDGHGARDAHQENVRRLEEAGGGVAVFSPLEPGWLIRAYRRNHRRAIVMDGVVGFTGGAAVADTWLGNAQDPEHWRDDLVRVTGPIARSLQAAFAQLWSTTTGTFLTGEEVFPSNVWQAEGGEPLARHLSVVSSPAGSSDPIRKVFWASVTGARERLWITTPYFVPDASLCDALGGRAEAGVDVRILTASRDTDLPITRWAAHAFYEALLEAGVRIFEYEPTLIHTKLLVSDGVWSVIGSPNFDIRSLDLNEENVLAIHDEGFGGQLEERFRLDLERAREIELPRWQHRALGQRLREWIALLVRRQL